MTHTDLKRSLIAKINEIQDPAFLKALLVITDNQVVTPTKAYTWGESPARSWFEHRRGQEASTENFFEDMEQLLRDNH